MQPDLPYVDRHAVTVAAPPPEVWQALQAYVDRALAVPGPGPKRLLTRVLGTVPAAGFEPHVDVPGRRLRLIGQHRFSRYALVLQVAPVGSGTELAATTYAVFPGVHGQAYHTLVIRSRLHVLATRRMLHTVAGRSAGAASG